MNGENPGTSLEKLQKELDRAIIAAKMQIEAAYARALARSVALWELEEGTQQYERLDAELREKYQRELSETVSRLENEFRRKAVAAFAQMTDGLPSRTGSLEEFCEKYRNLQELSEATRSRIVRSGQMLSQETRLLARLQRDPRTAIRIGELRSGKLSASQLSDLKNLLKDPAAVRTAAGTDIGQWRKSVYGINTTGNAASILGNAVERELVKDHYGLQNTMGRDVPEILGYRISVRSSTRRGTPRKRDICDEYAGDYSPDFVFTGWHYNCRCRCNPLINAALLTAELKAKGFIGIASDKRLTRMPPGVSSGLSSSRQRYREKFPELVEANFVEHRGQTRLLAEMSSEEQLEYYLSRFGGDFLKDANDVRVTLSVPSDPEVFMDTRLSGNTVRFNLSTRTAPDGHNPAGDLLTAFKKSGTGVPLTREQLSAASDITHEMVHTMSRDYPFARLEELYPQWRDELLDFTLYPDSYQRRSLEMITEWYAREIFPQVAREQGWTLPRDYRSAIGTGYTNLVDNLETFLRYVPDPDDFRKRLSDILRRGDKAMAYRFLSQAIRESKTLRNARSAEPALKKMLDEQDPAAFERYMEKNARNPPRAATAVMEVAQSTGTAAALHETERLAQAIEKAAGKASSAAKAAEAVKRLGSGLDLHRDALAYSRFMTYMDLLRHTRRPIFFLLPFGMIDEMYNRSQAKAQQAAETPSNGLPVRQHYLSPERYRGRGQAAAVTAGVVDGVIDFFLWPLKTVAGIAEYASLGIAKGLSLQPMSEGPFKEKLREWGEKYDAINQNAEELGLALIEFQFEYLTNMTFRDLFVLQMEQEFDQYFKALKGSSEAQGYEKGRLAIDIASFLLPAGGLLKLMRQWKRIGTFRLSDFFRKNLPAPPKKPAQELIKTETKILTDGPAAAVEAHAPKALPPATTLIENTADREAYEKYLKRKAREGKTPRGFDDWKQQSDYMRNQSPLARGRRFDKKAENEKWYDYNQIHLSNGKRLDSYNPETGQIVSRKSIDLSKISIYTFEQHLKELNTKYQVGTIIRSNKHSTIDGQTLKGKYYLEIPDYNKDLPELEKFINLARKYNAEIIFKPE